MATTGSVRELARRVGVSDVAIGKARRTGRIPESLFGLKESGRPYVLDMAAAEKVVREAMALPEPSERPSADKAKPQQGSDKRPPAEGVHEVAAGGYQKARTIREAYAAKMAQLDYEQKIGQIVSKDDMKAALFAAGRQLRDTLTQLPTRLGPQLASEQDQHVVSMLLAQEINEALKELAHAFQRATGDH